MRDALVHRHCLAARRLISRSSCAARWLRATAEPDMRFLCRHDCPCYLAPVVRKRYIKPAAHRVCPGCWAGGVKRRLGQKAIRRTGLCDFHANEKRIHEREQAYRARLCTWRRKPTLFAEMANG